MDKYLGAHFRVFISMAKFQISRRAISISAIGEIHVPKNSSFNAIVFLPNDFAVELFGKRGGTGVYVKNFSTGEEIAYGAERKWNLTALVKIPLAIAILQAIENKQLALDDQLQQPSDAGSAKPGRRQSIGDLLQRSVVDNDNTATDMLMRKLGVDAFNQQTQRNVDGKDLGPFTPGRHDKNRNTGTLRAMGTLMERLGRGELLNAKHTDLLLDYMEKVPSGEQHDHSAHAQKGTNSTCNLGISDARDLSKAVVIVVCAEGFGQLAHAEKSFTAIANILVADGRVP
jgi:hypothetical protein